MVKSVVLAWGSLVWDPRELKTAVKFTPDGPLLPIEFCRISADGRLTLAIDLMRRIKASFDPGNLFNPGKVFYA